MYSLWGLCISQRQRFTVALVTWKSVRQVINFRFAHISLFLIRAVKSKAKQSENTFRKCINDQVRSALLLQPGF